jgi:hypothetical protein
LPEFHPINPALKQTSKYQKQPTLAPSRATYSGSFACTRSHAWSRALSHGARFIIHPLDSNLAVFGECLRCIKHYVYRDVKRFVYKSAVRGNGMFKDAKKPARSGLIRQTVVKGSLQTIEPSFEVDCHAGGGRVCPRANYRCVRCAAVSAHVSDQVRICRNAICVRHDSTVYGADYICERCRSGVVFSLDQPVRSGVPGR